MTDWTKDLNAEEQKQWDDFINHARTDLVHKMESSALVMSLVPKGDVDIKFAVELGVSIMMNKPIIAVAAPEVEVPPGLRRVADYVIELQNDLDTVAGQAELEAILPEAIRVAGTGG